MEQYVLKSAVVAEIEKRKNICEKVILDLRTHDNKAYYSGKAQAYGEVLDYLDTLEVKEVDLERELSYEDYVGFFKEHPDFPDDWGFDEAWVFAKHFFELGLKAQKGENNITRKEVENLKERFKPIHDSGCRMFGSEAYDSHIKEVLKFFGYDTEDGVIKEIFDI